MTHDVIEFLGILKCHNVYLVRINKLILNKKNLINNNMLSYYLLGIQIDNVIICLKVFRWSLTYCFDGIGMRVVEI